MPVIQWRMESNIGPLYLVASQKGLRGVFFKKQQVPIAGSLRGRDAEITILLKASRQLKEYMGGKRKKFKVRVQVPDRTENYGKKFQYLIRATPKGAGVSSGLLFRLNLETRKGDL